MPQKVDVSNTRLFKDLVEYTKLPPELVVKRCQYAATELAVLWQSKKSVTDFYQSSDLYLFDLTKYQLLLQRHNLVQQMIEQIKSLKLRKVLEYGGGIGEFSLLCSENGLSPHYFELEGSIKRYALWRFTKHNAQSITVDDRAPLSQTWDVVNVMDVLEHLEEPNEVLDELKANARYIFCNPDEIKYNVFFPQHISKYDLSPNFQRVEGYLWKNQQL